MDGRQMDQYKYTCIVKYIHYGIGYLMFPIHYKSFNKLQQLLAISPSMTSLSKVIHKNFCMFDIMTYIFWYAELGLAIFFQTYLFHVLSNVAQLSVDTQFVSALLQHDLCTLLVEILKEYLDISQIRKILPRECFVLVLLVFKFPFVGTHYYTT